MNLLSTDQRPMATGSEPSLLEVLHDAVFAADRHGVITAWSRGAQRLYGYAPAEVLGLPLTFLCFPEDLEHHRETILAPALTHGINRLVVRHRRKDGAALLVELRLARRRNGHGTRTQLIGCADDLSKVRRETALSPDAI